MRLLDIPAAAKLCCDSWFDAKGLNRYLFECDIFRRNGEGVW